MASEQIDKIIQSLLADFDIVEKEVEEVIKEQIQNAGN
jgi:hypothetical protein